MKKITSLANLHIKRVVKLRQRGARKETGLTLIDGLRELSRAAQAQVAFQELYVCRNILAGRGTGVFLDELASSGVPLFEVSEDVFQKISFGDRREGVVAVCQPRACRLKELEQKECGLFVVVENVEKPGNLGAVLRICDGAGVDALLVSDEQSDIFSPNCIRASTGTVFTVPVVQARRDAVLSFLRQRGALLVAATPLADKVYSQVNLLSALAIVAGSERDGLSDFWLNNSDARVKIPMAGTADSLNVAVSVAVIVYEAVRQRARL